MVYGMALQSGGVARIDSAPEVGTTVKIYFRSADDAVATAESPDEAAAMPERRQRARAAVLVIDDDPDVRAFISESLAEQGYKVREAADGRAGLAAIAEAPADLVVLDFIMPGLSGAEVASRILTERPEQ